MEEFNPSVYAMVSSKDFYYEDWMNKVYASFNGLVINTIEGLRLQYAFTNGVLLSFRENDREQQITFACSYQLQYSRDEQIRHLWSVLLAVSEVVGDLEGSVTIKEDYSFCPSYIEQMDICHCVVATNRNWKGAKNLREVFIEFYEKEPSLSQ